jgi:hypothetical protein
MLVLMHKFGSQYRDARSDVVISALAGGCCARIDNCAVFADSGCNCRSCEAAPVPGGLAAVHCCVTGPVQRVTRVLCEQATRGGADCQTVTYTVT